MPHSKDNDLKKTISQKHNGKIGISFASPTEFDSLDIDDESLKTLQRLVVRYDGFVDGTSLSASVDFPGESPTEVRSKLEQLRIAIESELSDRMASAPQGYADQPSRLAEARDSIDNVRLRLERGELPAVQLNFRSRPSEKFVTSLAGRSDQIFSVGINSEPAPAPDPATIKALEKGACGQ